MLLSAVSVLVVAQSSSEIPEGLMNNPVYSPLYPFNLKKEADSASQTLFLRRHIMSQISITTTFVYVLFPCDREHNDGRSMKSSGDSHLTADGHSAILSCVDPRWGL